ncbi:MAG: hypothetical protein MO853_10145 [Candidatus Protistobacter heckmanni]|nr:hypothetical protein [Candidatus Protistobacter heckmanni]
MRDKRTGVMHRRWWATALLLAAAASTARATPSPPVPGAQENITWLWDQAALPTWSQGKTAVLIQHILLSGRAVLELPRRDAPELPAGVRVTLRLHVEVSTVVPPVSIADSRETILHAMDRAARISTSGWVQLDMEARPSQRAFYRELVAEIRARLPTGVRLSVTALAWWFRAGAIGSNP